MRPFELEVTRSIKQECVGVVDFVILKFCQTWKEVRSVSHSPSRCRVRGRLSGVLDGLDIWCNHGIDVSSSDYFVLIFVFYLGGRMLFRIFRF